MDLEKTYDRFDREALWIVLRIYSVEGWLLEGIKAFYRGASVCVKVNGELSDSFDMGVRVQQGCVMSPWLFSIFMDGSMKEMKAKVGNVGVIFKLSRCDWTASLFADDTVLLTNT